jgi:hypothetical protein
MLPYQLNRASERARAGGYLCLCSCWRPPHRQRHRHRHPQLPQLFSPCATRPALLLHAQLYQGTHGNRRIELEGLLLHLNSRDPSDHVGVSSGLARAPAKERDSERGATVATPISPARHVFVEKENGRIGNPRAADNVAVPSRMKLRADSARPRKWTTIDGPRSDSEMIRDPRMRWHRKFVNVGRRGRRISWRATMEKPRGVGANLFPGLSTGKSRRNAIVSTAFPLIT